MNNFFEDTDIIYSYSRQNLIDDGLLIVVPEKLTKEAGFLVQIDITLEVWESCITWSDEDDHRQVPQDQAGRLWDLLTMLRYAAKKDAVLFTIIRFPRDGKPKRPQMVELKAVIGPGDSTEPVITVILPDQD